jgi:hypothetical protein
MQKEVAPPQKWAICPSLVQQWQQTTVAATAQLDKRILLH